MAISVTTSKSDQVDFSGGVAIHLLENGTLCVIDGEGGTIGAFASDVWAYWINYEPAKAAVAEEPPTCRGACCR